MKYKLKNFSVILFAILLAAIFASCGKQQPAGNENNSNSEVTTLQGGSQNGNGQTNGGMIDETMSPGSINPSVPAEEYAKTFAEIDTSSFSQGENSDGEKLLSSDDGSYSVTYLEREDGSVYAYKYADDVNAVNYYYGSDDGRLYCISLEDYSGNTYYYVNSSGELKGIQITTYSTAQEQTETVYDSEGTRIAARHSDETGMYFFDSALTQIEGEAYNSAVADYIEARG